MRICCLLLCTGLSLIYLLIIVTSILYTISFMSFVWVVDELVFKIYVYFQFTVSNLSKCEMIKNINAYMKCNFYSSLKLNNLMNNYLSLIWSARLAVQIKSKMLTWQIYMKLVISFKKKMLNEEIQSSFIFIFWYKKMSWLFTACTWFTFRFYSLFSNEYNIHVLFFIL